MSEKTETEQQSEAEKKLKDLTSSYYWWRSILTERRIKVQQAEESLAEGRKDYLRARTELQAYMEELCKEFDKEDVE